MIEKLEFETIRLRSQVAEALSLFLIQNPAYENKKDILIFLHKTSDVIEHIAQYAVEDLKVEHRVEGLVLALDALLYILKKYDVELKNVRLNIPDMNAVNKLKKNVCDFIFKNDM
ncbi:hypothetical protein AW19_4134 (plasmid) [Yersinia frederiksenii Y225]|nr:hypothetical protein AW19_4134 [Yersinia frederiksenii Y225]